MIRFSDQADQDLDQLVDHIAWERGGRSAALMIRTILSSISHLGQFPELGRPGRVAETREFVIHGSPYLAVYELSGSDVNILRVLHGAQLWPPDPDH